MAQDDEDLPPEQPARRKRWRKAAGVLFALVLLGLGYVWLTRERIADDFIAGQLEALDLPATYEVVSIGPRRQVLKNIVVGDPKRPDLTIERAEIAVALRWGTPGIGSVTLTRPRLYGKYRDGRVSFGSLDRLIYTGGNEPFRLPDMRLAVTDGRALIESPSGPIGIKLSGAGDLRGGFSAELAAVAPDLSAEGCQATRASLYGKVSISGEQPRFVGPLRLRSLDCPAMTLRMANAGLQIDARVDKALDGGEGKLGLRSGLLAYGDNRLASLGGAGGFTFRKQALTARYDLAAQGIATPSAAADSIRLAGVLRGGKGFARVETEGQVEGGGLRLGDDLDRTLASAQKAGEGTLAVPLLAKVRSGLTREGENSALSAAFVLRRAPGSLNLVIPQATLRGGSGEVLLALSRFQLEQDGEGIPLLSGNFSSGGENLPRLAGRMERQADGRLALSMALADYSAGDARIAVPRLLLVQLPSGALGFAGEARLSGALPGGRADNLQVPIEGNWSSRSGLALWRNCVTVAFDRLALADLAFERRRLELCPPRGGAIVRSDGAGTRIAAGTPSLDLVGRLGQTPLRLRTGAVGVAVPGVLTARTLDVALGPAATASRFRIASLDARIGSDVAGRFAGTDVLLSAVPLDILAAEGTWRFAGGRLTLGDAAFRLEDRELDDRFQPLVARGAQLTLIDNRIAAEALLREPTSDREVVQATIRHDLSTGRGNAALAVAALTFDQKLQPDTLSRLALGVIANAKGTVSGSGRIDWTENAVTSSGRFGTESLDFAAAFGPVQGVSGTVEFTDLLGMVTAPGQQLRIASINPGIEVNDGVLTFEMRPGNVLAVKGGSWPFLEGRLTLQPVVMNMGIAETRRYVLTIEGLNAARFVERLELANIATTGTFDGELPLVFDENGGRIEGGMLIARPPGGSVSYVGALSYEDLSPMANFAFDALKSLDYREMSIGMDGALEGEIVTRVQFRGVSQGATAKRNFLTQRIAKLPIQFNLNLRAPFFQLISSFKSFYDPAYVRDPRSLGLIDSAGKPVNAPRIMLPPVADRPNIQPAESEPVR